uniref:Uncharacterized protein n=1 Tax=Dunaliella tertiolecta TaxID=3047 RepID=A0A7S3R6T1_DUNTE
MVSSRSSSSSLSMSLISCSLRSTEVKVLRRCVTSAVKPSMSWYLRSSSCLLACTARAHLSSSSAMRFSYWALSAPCTDVRLMTSSTLAFSCFLRFAATSSTFASACCFASRSSFSALRLADARSCAACCLSSWRAVSAAAAFSSATCFSRRAAGSVANGSAYLWDVSKSGCGSNAEQ